MILSAQRTTIAITTLSLSALTWFTGCSNQGGSATYGTTGTRLSEPSGGGAKVAEERPGAGVGAQTSVGAAADVPEATQKGAGASNLTEPGESASSSDRAEASSAGTQAGTSSAGASAGTASTTQLSGNQTSTNMAIPLYKEQLQVGKREVTDGSVRIRKYVTTETVNQPMQVRREAVTVEQVPAGSQAAQGTSQAAGGTGANALTVQPFQEQDITIQLHHEEPVVSKQVQRQGEVVARVQTQVQQTNIQGQVRREQVQVTKQGNPQNVSIAQNLVGPSSGTAAMGGSSEAGGGQTQGAGGSSTAGGQTQGAAASSGTPVTDATTLTSASDPSSLAGRQVRLSGLKVQQVFDQHFIEVSDNSGKPLFVRVNQPAQNLKPGDRVSLTGTVNRVPSDTTNLGLNEGASQALEDQSIYLEAQQLQVTGH